jgi:hypothetical protein
MPDAQELQSAKPGETDKRLKRNIINGYLKFGRLGKSIFELLPLGVVVFGLGLAICKDIIDGHQGRITAENAPEGGSIFTVYLPVGIEESIKG